MHRSKYAVSVAIMAVILFAQAAYAQKSQVGANAPAAGGRRVTQIDAAALKRVLSPKGKPLLVNFWATWCDPCREEFPELVKIEGELNGKVDFVTVSLDDAADINTAVPKFLSEMKADMPTYLLVTGDESAAIASIAKDWRGGLPFTILYNDKGEVAYMRQGKVIPVVLRAEIEKLIGPQGVK